MRFFFFCSVVVLIGACQSKPKSSVPAVLPPETGYPQTLGATPYLTGGYNRAAVFSYDGTKIYFISKERRDHRNSQIYEYDLVSKAERRITFQDGEILSVAAAPNEHILYASNTDEIKETPFAREQDYRYSRAEIYLSDRFGDQIDRLTNSPGFDGEMLYVPLKKQILFTSLRSGVAGLYWVDLDTGTVTPFQVSKTDQRSPALTPDGKSVYWVEEDPSSKTQKIVRGSIHGKEKEIVKSVPGAIKSLAVHATGAVAYAWQPKGSEFTEIDHYTPETQCNRILLRHTMSFLEPHFSANTPNVLLFRGTLKENSVVYRWELPEALGPCQ